MRQREKMRLSLSELLEPGNWILLFEDADKERKINAKIIKFIGDNKCLIESDDLSKKQMPLDISIHYGRTTGLYKIKGGVKDTDTEGQYLLQSEEEGVKIQERNFIRIDIDKDIKVAVLNSASHKGDEFSAIVKNISAGGAKLRSDNQILTGYFVDVIFSEMEKFPYDKLTAEVLWDTTIEEEDEIIYESGVQFICSEGERNKIARYVNQKQLEFRRKGKI